MMGSYTKQPRDAFDYDIECDFFPEGDNIFSITTAVTRLDGVPVGPGDLIVDRTTNNDPDIKVWVSGGVDGRDYKITVLVVTNEGRQAEDEFKIKVREQ